MIAFPLAALAAASLVAAPAKAVVAGHWSVGYEWATGTLGGFGLRLVYTPRSLSVTTFATAGTWHRRHAKVTIALGTPCGWTFTGTISGTSMTGTMHTSKATGCRTTTGTWSATKEKVK